MKPSKAQVRALSYAAEQPDGTLEPGSHVCDPGTSLSGYGFRAKAVVTTATVQAIEQRGWATARIVGSYRPEWIHFTITAPGRALPEVVAEVARRQTAREADLARQRAKTEARDRQIEAAQVAEAARQATIPHRQTTALPRPTVFGVVAGDEHQGDDLRNEVACTFLDAIDGGPGERPDPALDAAWALLTGIFDRALRVWAPAAVEAGGFPEDAATLRALPPVVTPDDVTRYASHTEPRVGMREPPPAKGFFPSFRHTVWTMAEETEDTQLVWGACRSTDALAGVARFFQERTRFSLDCAARNLGEIAGDTGHADDARRLLTHLMLPTPKRTEEAA